MEEGSSLESGALSRMESDWDDRARENAAYYVANGCEEWDQQEFFRSGEINVENEILGDSEIWRCGPASDRQMLEIGCGVGRMTRCLAGHFRKVHAVDISSEMLSLARRNLAGIENVSLYKTGGSDLSALGSEQFDFAFSYIVFQHIPSRQAIESYVREVHRCLKPGRVFKFQVRGDGDAAKAPDTWEGAAISPDEARVLACACGFELLKESGAGTQYYWLWFLKPYKEFSLDRLRAVAANWFRQAARMLRGPVVARFRPAVTRPGEEYEVSIPSLRGRAIDVEYELETAVGAGKRTGVVSNWVRLDAVGRARVQVAADHPAGRVALLNIRARCGGKWRKAKGAIEITAGGTATEPTSAVRA